VPDAGQRQQPFEVDLVEMGLVPHPQPDSEVVLSGHQVDTLHLGDRQHLLGELALVVAALGRDPDDDGERPAEQREVDLGPVAPDHAERLQPADAVGDRGRRHADGAGDRALGQPGVLGEVLEDPQVRLVEAGRHRHGNLLVV
jgi:hypothetical protein